MLIQQIDHLVLTVKDTEKICVFYKKVLGMEVISFEHNRKALKFGNQKINIHQLGQEFEPKASLPTPGSYDICFITTTPIEKVINHMKKNETKIIEGPVKRTGAAGSLTSIYLRDPDGNLLEIANQD